MAASPSGPVTVPTTAIRRLRRDLEQLRQTRHPHIAVQPSGANFLEWHFVLHSLPPDTPYQGGCYHGRIIFPPEYPLSPPSILMCTPSGRFQTGRRLCLTMTDFHPGAWNPAWSVETILVGFLSFFLAEGENGIGTLRESEDLRRSLAAASWTVNAGSPDFCELFPEFVSGQTAVTAGAADAPPPGAAASAAGEGEEEGRQAAAMTAPQVASSEGERATPAAASDVADAGVGSITAPASPQSPAEAVDGARAPSQEEPGMEPTECWICRDVSATEPLIRPCACRGSMSGVHARCVEQWIHHHQRTSSSTEPPRCPVCHQRYKGKLRRPGLALFLWQLCRRAAIVFQQFALWVVLCNGFVLAAGGPKYTGGGQSLAAKMPLVVRVAVAILFWGAVAYTMVVLTVSLPPLEPPPQHPLMRHFFVPQRWRLVKHVADAIIALSILTDQYASGNLRLSYFLVFLAVAAIPYSKCLWKVAGIRRNRLGRGHQLVHCCLLAAACIPMLVLKMMPRDLRRAAHPLGAGPHILAAVAVIPLCTFCATSRPLLVLLEVHGVLLAAGLIEVLAVKRLRWQRGTRWALAVWCAVCAMLYANNVSVPPAPRDEGVGLEGEREAQVLGFTLLWLCLVLALAVAVNWAICVRVYRIWQRRHGVFALQQPPAPPPDAARSADAEYQALPDGP